MQQVSENLLFEHKKTYIDSYVALYKYLNDFFVKKLTDLNTSNLHRDPEQKTKLLFHFVHYSSIRSMKSVIESKCSTRLSELSCALRTETNQRQ